MALRDSRKRPGGPAPSCGLSRCATVYLLTVFERSSCDRTPDSMQWTAPDSPSFALPSHLGFASRFCLGRLDAVEALWRFSTQLDADPIQAGFHP